MSLLFFTEMVSLIQKQKLDLDGEGKKNVNAEVLDTDKNMEISTNRRTHIYLRLIRD